MRRAIALVLLVSSGCSYQFGATRNAHVPAETYEGIGWDGDLALGSAMEDATRARHAAEYPDYVQMNCTMYGVKPVLMGAGGALAGAEAAKGNGGIAIGVAIAAAAAFFIPNCFATIGYNPRPVEQRPRAARPMPVEPPDEPIRMKAPPPDGGDEADAGQPPSPPPAPLPAANQAHDREKPRGR